MFTHELSLLSKGLQVMGSLVPFSAACGLQPLHASFTIYVGSPPKCWALPLPLICTHGALSCLTAGTFKSFCCRADEREQWNKPLLPSGGSGKETACQYRRRERCGSDPWVGKIPWRAQQPTPVFLPGESNGQRSLEGCSPQGHKESDMTEVT